MSSLREFNHLYQEMARQPTASIWCCSAWQSTVSSAWWNRERFVVGLRNGCLFKQLEMDRELMLQKAVNKVSRWNTKKKCCWLTLKKTSPTHSWTVCMGSCETACAPNNPSSKTDACESTSKTDSVQKMWSGWMGGGYNMLNLWLLCFDMEKMKNKVCSHCRKKGHYARVCRTKHRSEV